MYLGLSYGVDMAVLKLRTEFFEGCTHSTAILLEYYYEKLCRLLV